MSLGRGVVVDPTVGQAATLLRGQGLDQFASWV
jgi:hypothetical protein